MAQGTVFAMLEDAEGFLWFGTQDGLSRWDGYTMRIWRHDEQDTASLAPGYVRALCQDRAGVLWVGTEGGGLCALDPRTGLIHHQRHKENDAATIGSDHVFALVEDTLGSLWVGTAKGLDRLSPDRTAFVHVQEQGGEGRHPWAVFVNALHLDPWQHLWIGTKQGLYNRNSTTGRITQHDLVDGTVNTGAVRNIKAIHADRSGRVWVGSYGEGLWVKPDAAHHFEQVPVSERGSLAEKAFVYGIAEDDEGRLWVAMYGGLRVYTKGGSLVRVVKNDPLERTSLTNDLIIAVYRARNGSIWTSTSGQGVCDLDLHAPPFHAVTAHTNNGPALGNAFIYGMHEDGEGVVWFATAGGGVVWWDRSNGGVTDVIPQITRDLGSHIVRCITEDAAGNVWIGTDKGGLHCYDRRSGLLRHYMAGEASGLRSNIILTLMVDRGGTLWVGTYNGGLSRYDPTTDRFYTYTHSDADARSLSDDIVRCMVQDPEGGLWIGTGTGGLDLLALGSSSFAHHRHSAEDRQSISHNAIRSLHMDTHGILWAGTNGGGLNALVLGRAAAHGWRSFTQRDGLANNVIYGILEDGAGDLWLSTNLGITRFRAPLVRSALLSGTAITAPPGLCRNYAAADGLHGAEFNGGAMLRASDGALFFGGVEGFTWFHPDSIIDARYTSRIVLTGFQVMNRDVLVDPRRITSPDVALLDGAYRSARTIRTGDTIRLTYREPTFAVEVSAPGFPGPARVVYAYRLEGFDKDWNDLGPRRFINLTNINAGHYTLWVKARHGGAAWGPGVAVLRVEITPPFWRTPWFMVACVVVGLLAVRAFIHMRTRKLRRTKEQLTRVVEERTREVETQKALLESRNTRLVELDRLNKKIFSVFSHDLRGPFLSLQMLMDVLKEHIGKNERVAAHTDQLRVQLAHTERVLENLLGWSQFELNDEWRTAEALAQPALLMAEVVAELRAEAVVKNVVVRSDIPPENRTRAQADVIRIVYRNLVGNAIKYSPPNGVVTCGFDTNTEEYFVADMGGGIPAGLLPDLFERPVHSSLGTGHEKGFGIGLLITGQLVAKSGGRIRVLPEVPGTCIRFTLPIA